MFVSTPPSTNTPSLLAHPVPELGLYLKSLGIFATAFDEEGGGFVGDATEEVEVLEVLTSACVPQTCQLPFINIHVHRSMSTQRQRHSDIGTCMRMIRCYCYTAAATRRRLRS